MFKISQLTVSYGQHLVLNHLDWELPKGQIHGLVGLNGAGKTTLFNTLFGIIKAQKGTISFDNQPFTKNHLGYLETQNYFYSYLTGREHLSIFQFNNPQFDSNHWNSLFNLPLDDLVETYSTGMKKKLAFMALLCQNKPFLLLDEPFNALDLETNQQLRLIIKALADKGKTVLVTSHIMESLTLLCDTISYLENGKIVFCETKENFANIEQRIFHQQSNLQEKINSLINS